MSNEQKLSAVSWSRVKEEYPVAKFIHVLPAEDSVFQHKGAADWRLDVTIVDFDPYDEKDCYAIEKREAVQADADAGLVEAYKAGDRGQYTNFRPRFIPETVGLTKAALERLTAAAGASVVPIPGQVTLRIDDRTDPLFQEFACMAVLASKNGEIRTDPASRSWDGRLREEVLVRRCEKRFERTAASGKKVEVPGVGWRPAASCTDDEKRAAIRSWYADDWLREREFGPLMAESKAKNRARRSLLALAAKFTVAEIRDKAFVVPRWVFSPDLSDPATRNLVIGHGLQQQTRGFLLPSAPVPALAAGIPEGTPVETVAAKGSPSPVEDEVAAEAAEDPFAGAAEAEVEEVEPVDQERAPTIDQQPEAENEPDDIDAIANEELSFYVAAAIKRYSKPDRKRVMDNWTQAASMNNPAGYAALRKILRHVHKGLVEDAAGKESNNV